MPKQRDLRLLSVQDRRSPLGLLRAGLGGLSARLEEKVRLLPRGLRRLWEIGWEQEKVEGDEAEGEEALEPCRGREEDDEVGKEVEVFSNVGEVREEEMEGEGEEEGSRGFRG